ncbi:MAG: S26 family signal peptidase [Christensenellaceae bacterium]|jgi:signal peptidase I|nr:S26 family signal peptidase [Christensenellaceae bacterium]
MRKGFSAQQHTRQSQGKGIRESTARSRVGGAITVAVSSLIICLCVVLVAFSMAYFLSPVDGPSMKQTINAEYTNDNPKNTDSVIVSKNNNPENVARGDIIITRFYDKEGKGDYVDENGKKYKLFIKRLIAKEGDTLTFVQKDDDNDYNGHRYQIEVNGVPINESYLDPIWGRNIPFDGIYNFINSGGVGGSVDSAWRSDFKKFIQEVYYPNGLTRYEIVLPKGYWFFMGDNRGGDGSPEMYNIRSWDCTAFGPQLMANFVGKIVEIIPNSKSLTTYAFEKMFDWLTFNWD